MKSENFTCKWNDSEIQIMAACKEYMASGKKHNGAKMRINNGFFCVRDWNKCFQHWVWTPICKTPARKIAEIQGL